jgi:hypothetical protein
VIQVLLELMLRVELEKMEMQNLVDDDDQESMVELDQDYSL